MVKNIKRVELIAKSVLVNDLEPGYNFNALEKLLENPEVLKEDERYPKIQRLKTTVSKKRTDVIKWNGWGYNDSKFDVKDGIIHFTGNRYPIGELQLPYFTEWVKTVFNADVEKKNLPVPMPPANAYPESKITKEFLDELKESGISWSIEGTDRLVRCHGQTLHDIYSIRFTLKYEMPKMPDVVVWPDSHDQVVKIVELATKHNVVVLPYGGGTSVSGAVTCPEDEERPICSLDTSQMNGVLWLDMKSLLICCQCGITGQDLERYVNACGYTCGHEPDSYEFSTVGGWVATRASGMKKNVYGNIEDILISVKMVTPSGVVTKRGCHPRQSTGPDMNHVILGSEGTLGVVTEVVMKVRPMAKYKKYGSLVFPYFSAGMECMREIARQRCQPASIRLMDNEQFKFGQALRPVGGCMSHVSEALKTAYLTKIKGYFMDNICVATLLFEGGDKKSVEDQEKKIYEIAKEYQAIPAGAKNGERGYMLTFVIAYIRDLGLDFNVVAESFETSVPWAKALTVCQNVKYAVKEQCGAYGIKYYLISHRVTQTYDSGCCIYFYFAFNWTGLEDPVTTYEEIEAALRQEILRSGGSLSHHHGVGKLRARWYRNQVSDLAAEMYSKTKQFLDPKNIFATGNLLPKAKL